LPACCCRMRANGRFQCLSSSDLLSEELAIGMHAMPGCKVPWLSC
jgi:hypothetical protein